MKKCMIVLMAALLFLLAGCGAQQPAEETQPVQTVPAATVPADGDPETVACKGSYTGQIQADTVAARVGETSLTLEHLQVWYWAQVAQYRQEGHAQSPDFDRPLDTQICEIDDSAASWQQYFLKEALNAWHTAQALVLHSQEVPLPTEEEYQPSQKNYNTYMKGMPAAELLYGYHEFYRPNSMHQAYLDSLPETLAELARQKGYADTEEMAQRVFGSTGGAVEQASQLQNLAYMYFTQLSYGIEPSQEELVAFYEGNREQYPQEETCVSIRHILLTGEETAELEKEAAELLRYWQKKTKGGEGAFADLAYHNSQDAGSALNGGRYYRVRKGQLIPELDSWCFDPAREPGDTTVVESSAGLHILYFSEKQEGSALQAQEDYYRYRQQDLLREIRQTYPMEVDYSAIVLAEAAAQVSAGELLYPDVAHERFPEIPLYLQQDYGGTMYGNFPLNSNGCGITSLAMLATYMTDEEWTPPEMCRRYGNYSHYNGTDGMIFIHEPPEMGFYLRKNSHNVNEVKAALQEGQIVISVQRSGYWTRAGHYIVLESIDEADKVQVRDSNLYNYGRIKGHKIDSHAWGTVTAAASGYWIYEDKVTRIPNCSRCGEDMDVTGNVLTEDYTCEKCIVALRRRDTFLQNEVA